MFIHTTNKWINNHSCSYTKNNNNYCVYSTSFHKEFQEAKMEFFCMFSVCVTIIMDASSPFICGKVFFSLFLYRINFNLLSAHDISRHMVAVMQCPGGLITSFCSSLNICKLCFKFLQELSEC